MNASDDIDKIENAEDFSKFIEDLLEDYANNPEQWGNDTLETFLRAMSAWCSDSDGYYQNAKIAKPVAETWKNFARILLASRIYE